VFADRAALDRLERLVHPAVERSRRQFLRSHRARPLVVLDIPLLFEKSGWRRVDTILVVSAAAWQQRKRVLARPGMTAAKLARIRALQTPDAQKRRRADFVVPTGGTRLQTAAALRRFLACLGERAGR
jgi:dephospho-CoA kinase